MCMQPLCYPVVTRLFRRSDLLRVNGHVFKTTAPGKLKTSCEVISSQHLSFSGQGYTYLLNPGLLWGQWQFRTSGIQVCMLVSNRYISAVVLPYMA